MESEEIIFYIDDGKRSIVPPIKGCQVYYVKPSESGKVRVADYRETGITPSNRLFNELDNSIEFLIEMAQPQ